jgi:HNH endonuclease
MGFCETLKARVRKKANFRCCLCEQLGVQIHHVIPQEENGPDDEDNAAPLCPSCHDKYGANPLKRKFITEARDHWYERCALVDTSSAIQELRREINQLRADMERQLSGANLASRTPSPATVVELQKFKGGYLVKAITEQMAFMAPESLKYNSFAWALGETDRWWYPDETGVCYWPEFVERTNNLATFKTAFASRGFSESDTSIFELGFDKIALHVDEIDQVSHAARMLADGKWSSKLGALEVYQYDDVNLLVPLYGRVAMYTKRPAANVR